MKLKQLSHRFFLAALLLLAALQVQAVKLDAEHFPDDNFRAQLIFQFGWTNNAEITQAQLQSATVLNVANKYISSLEGIQYLRYLTELNCSNNLLTSLSLDGLHYVRKLVCNNNQLTTLSVTGSQSLEYLNCNSNNLETLDVSYAHQLKTLLCANNTNLSTLETYNHFLLTTLNCGKTKLSALNTKKMPQLRELTCNSTKISALDLSKNDSIRTLDCNWNTLSELDLSNLEKLENLDCSHNNLSGLDLSAQKELKYLTCSQNSLTELDLSQQTKLKKLGCTHNKLTRLVLPATDELWYVACNDNRLKDLRVDKLPYLETLHCQNNYLTTLDLSANTMLSPSTTITSPNSLYNIYKDTNSKYAIPLYGDDGCFQASRFTGFNHAGTNYQASIADGYLQLPTFNNSYDVIYYFDTGNSKIGTMLVKGTPTYKGLLTAINDVSIYDYTWPQDFEPADNDASCDNGTVTRVGFIMYNKMFDEYDGVAGDVLKVAFEVELDEGFIYGSSPVVHVDNTYNDLIYSPFNNQRKKRFVFNYTVPVPEGGRYIRTVSENIALPIEGAIPEFQTESMASAQAKGRAKPHDPVSLYTVNQVFWIEVDPEGESMNFMTPTDRFKGGYYYYLILAMTPNDGYQFSEKTKVILNSATYSETATISLNAKQETNGFIDIEGPVAGVFFHLEKTTPTAIQEPKPQVRDSRWYTIDGRPLGSEPTAPGIYIRNGRKVVIGK